MLDIQSEVDEKELSQSIKFELEYFGEPTGAFLWVTGGQTTRASQAVSQTEISKLFQDGLAEYAELDIGSDYNQSKIAASRICKWENIGLNGVPLKYSKENALLLVSEYDWVVEQIVRWSSIVDDYIKEITEQTLEYAKWQFKYGAKQKDGASLKEHVEAAQNNPFAAALPKADVVLKSLEEESSSPLLPEAVSLLWTYFIRLHQQRASGGMGLSCLSYTDIKSFCDLNDIRLFPWEVDLITALDRAFLTQHYEDQERESKRASKK